MGKQLDSFILSSPIISQWGSVVGFLVWGSDHISITLYYQNTRLASDPESMLILCRVQYVPKNSCGLFLHIVIIHHFLDQGTCSKENSGTKWNKNVSFCAWICLFVCISHFQKSHPWTSLQSQGSTRISHMTHNVWFSLHYTAWHPQTPSWHCYLNAGQLANCVCYRVVKHLVSFKVDQNQVRHWESWFMIQYFLGGWISMIGTCFSRKH